MSDQWFADIIGNAAFEDVRQSLGLEATEEQRRLKQMAALAARMRESQRRRPKAKARNQNAHLRSIAVEVGILAPHVEYWITESGVAEECRRMRSLEAKGLIRAGTCASMGTLMAMEDALNGYVAFDKRNAPFSMRSIKEYDALLTYVPVHGGITYANKDQTACVFGFDTAHYNSDPLPRTDKTWMKWQCQVLYEGLMLARTVEHDYWKVRGDNQRVADLVQPLIDMVPEQEYNTGVILNMLGGDL